MDPPRPGIAYVVFNTYWDTFIGNVLDQSLRPLPARVHADRHLRYLECSLKTLRRACPPGRCSVTLWLVELDPGGMTGDELAALAGRAAPGLPCNVSVIGRELVEPHILDARSMPVEAYRSPNRLHEHVLLFAMDRTEEDELLIVDCDVLFTRAGAPSRLLSLLRERPGKVAAAFMDPPGPRPYLPEGELSRPRMHTVALALALRELRGLVDLGFLMDNLRFARQVAALRSAEARRYYSLYRTYDTFSFLTEHLRHGHGEDLLLRLDEAVPGYLAGNKLTLICEDLIHAKYLERDGHESLRQALALRPVEGDEARYALDLARESAEEARAWW